MNPQQLTLPLAGGGGGGACLGPAGGIWVMTHDIHYGLPLRQLASFGLQCKFTSSGNSVSRILVGCLPGKEGFMEEVISDLDL